MKVWVNNAGVLRTEKAWEHPDERRAADGGGQLLGVLWGSRAAVEAMRGHGGDIVNMASMSSFGAGARASPSTAPRSTRCSGFTESLQGDLDDAGIPIRTHAICPDGVDTGMVRERQADEDAAIIFSAPRLLSPEEVAQKAVSLIGRRRPLVAIPASRSVLVRTMAQFPRSACACCRCSRKPAKKGRPSPRRRTGRARDVDSEAPERRDSRRPGRAGPARLLQSLGWKSTTPATTSLPFHWAARCSASTGWTCSRRRATALRRRGTWSGVTLAVNVEREEMVAEAIETARAAGAEIRAEPVKRDWGGVSAYFADPEGNVWEVAWFPDGQFDERGALIWPD